MQETLRLDQTLAIADTGLRRFLVGRSLVSKIGLRADLTHVLDPSVTARYICVGLQIHIWEI